MTSQADSPRLDRDDQSSAPLTKIEREKAMSETREAARERARELREAHRKRDRRRVLIIAGSVVAFIAVVAAILFFAFMDSSRRGAVGPRNMLSDGVKVVQGFVAEPTEGLAPGQKPVASAPNPPDVVAIQVYYDYFCPNCGIFEERNGAQLRAWIETGAATVEYHPIAVFTAGTEYSRRAANAAACVADQSPKAFFAFHELLFANQPDENSGGLSDEQLIELARAAGANGIARCIENERFVPWVKAATQRAVNGPLPGTDVDNVKSTPTILVNGQEFQYTTAFDPNEFALFVSRIAGQAFAENPTPTPTPTPTGSATPTP